MTVDYRDNRSASVDRRQRIELLDLKDQREGEAHIFFKSQVVRAKMFFANPKPCQDMRLAHYLKVEIPSEEVIKQVNNRQQIFKKVLIENKVDVPQLPVDEDIMVISHALAESYNLSRVERGISALVAVLENELNNQLLIEESSNQRPAPPPSNKMSIFTSIPVNDRIKRMIGNDSVAMFEKSIIEEMFFEKKLLEIERMAGNVSNAKKTARNLKAILEEATLFPKIDSFVSSRTKYKEDLEAFIRLLGGEPPVAGGNNGNGGPSSDLFGSKGLPELPNLDLLPDFDKLNIFDFSKLPDLGSADSFEEISKMFQKNFEDMKTKIDDEKKDAPQDNKQADDDDK